MICKREKGSPYKNLGFCWNSTQDRPNTSQTLLTLIELLDTQKRNESKSIYNKQARGLSSFQLFFFLSQLCTLPIINVIVKYTVEESEKTMDRHTFVIVMLHCVNKQTTCLIEAKAGSSCTFLFTYVVGVK